LNVPFSPSRHGTTPVRSTFPAPPRLPLRQDLCSA
jgi:hypothetical protein